MPVFLHAQGAYTSQPALILSFMQGLKNNKKFDYSFYLALCTIVADGISFGMNSEDVFLTILAANKLPDHVAVPVSFGNNSISTFGHIYNQREKKEEKLQGHCSGFFS